MREWFTAAEILPVGPPSLPPTRRGLMQLIEREAWRDDPRRARRARLRGGRGGGYEYHLSLLPADVQARLIAQQTPRDPGREARSYNLWAAFDRLPDKAKVQARERLAIVQRVELLAAGMARRVAVALAASEAKVSTSSVWIWLRAVDGLPDGDRLPALASRNRGRTVASDCHPEAWEYIKADYLRAAAPAFDACYRRLAETATRQGWIIPSMKTLRRRLNREVPAGVITLKRAGREAAKRAFPHVVRDRTVFHAMQAVNADGHRMDVFVRWPDGAIARPHLIAVQDLYSNFIVGHRIDRSENWTAVRLAFADAVESFGIPEHAYFDNGRAFASKQMTGGTRHRFRFKFREDEPQGLLTQLGVKVHWTTPYHGQSKPIERAFRDLCEEVAKHPMCEGAYTGNKPDAKPENYGEKAIPLDAFTDLVAQQIVRFNMRQGRRTAIAAGRSFADVFRASYETAIVQKASPARLRLLLAAAEGVTCRKPDGSLYLARNRYWAEQLHEFIGRRLVVRFDPQNLLLPIAVYAPDGRFICEAECAEAVGFNDMDIARTHARNRANYLRHLRELAALYVTMSIDEIVRLNPPPQPPRKPVSKVIKLTANAPRPRAGEWDDKTTESFGAAMRSLENGAVLPFVRKDEGGAA